MSNYLYDAEATPVQTNHHKFIKQKTAFISKSVRKQIRKLCEMTRKFACEGWFCIPVWIFERCSFRYYHQFKPICRYCWGNFNSRKWKKLISSRIDIFFVINFIWFYFFEIFACCGWEKKSADTFADISLTSSSLLLLSPFNSFQSNFNVAAKPDEIICLNLLAKCK